MSGHTSICPHLVTSPGGHATRCRLAEFGLHALLADNERLKRGLRDLRTIVGRHGIDDHGTVRTLEQVQLFEAGELIDALLGHTVTPIQ